MQNWTSVLINSAMSYLSVFVISKMLGKKQVAQLTVVDYVVGITMGNIAGQWCTDYKNPWTFYLIGMGVFMVLSLFINFLERKIPFKRILKGKQLELITDGKINFPNLKKSKLDVNDLLGLCREKNYFDLSEVSYAFLENNGALSVLPKKTSCPVQKGDVLKGMSEKNMPAKYLIIDGHINKTVLSQLGKDETWLKKCCDIKDKKDLKNIILAEYMGKDNILLHKKGA